MGWKGGLWAVGCELWAVGYLVSGFLIWGCVGVWRMIWSLDVCVCVEDDVVG